ncbi:MAG: zinc/iron-chelating domain-containing protein [Desulfobulbus propionicus]|nr:MAG: zinc/iron-chelating domain-containing protein [Desulfobulbus propionicus]
MTGDQHVDKGLFGATDKNPSNILPQKLTLDSPLQFACHPGVSCFTACCHNIKIILTPYDILMLRKRLGISSAEFITQYATPEYLEKTDMPGVRLKLDEETGGCPFVTPEGCTVYEDRPSACRYYPVGMADFHESGEESREEKFFFIVKEPHCKGHEEPKHWTIREWRADQGVDLRDEMNKEWLRLVMRRKSFGRQAELSEQAQRMFFMASTDLESFRSFVFDSQFLQTYEVDAQTVEKIRDDDVELMLFAFKYLASALFGAQVLQLNQEKVRAKIAKMRKNQEESLRRAEEEYLELKKEREQQRRSLQAGG